MRKIILFSIFILMLFAIILFSYNHIRNNGTLEIVFIGNNPSKVIINDNVIIGIENIYKIKAGYGPNIIKIYYDDNNATVLKTFKENNWYKSRIEIMLNNNTLEIKYIGDMTKIFEIENVSVEIGQEIFISWL